MHSLEKLCLNLILEEFQRFNFSFAVSSNEIFKRYFKFLQRKYTFELVSGLSEKRMLKEEYLDFLLNDHLTYLDERWFRNIRKSVKDIIYLLPNLEKASLFNSYTNEILGKIAELCPKIIEINASYSSVTDTGVKYLCKNKNGKVPCPELKNLNIKSSKVTPEGVKYLLQNLPSLEKIAYKELPEILYSMHFKESVISCSHNLVVLNLLKASYLSYYSDLLKVCLTVCPNLKSLICYITDAKQINFFNNPKLEDLFLCSEAKVDINNFLKHNGSNLVSLKVAQCTMFINTLIASCPKLQCLDINRIDFLEDLDDSQCILRCLTEFIFSYTKNHDSCNKALSLLLSSSPNLEQLRITHGKLSLETEAHILKCCENNLLRKMTFFATEVEMGFAKDILLSCPSLKILSLEDCDYMFNKEKEIKEFAKKLKNKPVVYIKNSY